MEAYWARRWPIALLIVGLLLANQQPDLLTNVFAVLTIPIVAALTLFVLALNMDASELGRAWRQPRAALLGVLVNLAIGPVVCYLAATTLLEGDYRVGLIVTGCLPCTLTSAVLITRLARGDEAAALLSVFLSNLLATVLTPLWLLALTGKIASMSLADMMGRLVLWLVLPVLAGVAARRWRPLAQWADQNDALLAGVCRLLVLLVIFQAALTAKTKMLELNRSWSLADLGPVAAVTLGTHFVLLALGYTLGQNLLGAPSALAVGITGSQKTLPLGAALLAVYYPQYPLAMVSLLFFHVGQLVLDPWITTPPPGTEPRAVEQDLPPPVPPVFRED